MKVGFPFRLRKFTLLQWLCIGFCFGVFALAIYETRLAQTPMIPPSSEKIFIPILPPFFGRLGVG